MAAGAKAEMEEKLGDGGEDTHEGVGSTQYSKV